MSSAGADHHRSEVADTVIHPSQIRIQDLFPGFWCHFMERPGERSYSGIVNQYVGLPMGSLHASRELLNGFKIGHVTGKRLGLATCCRDAGGDRLHTLYIPATKNDFRTH